MGAEPYDGRPYIADASAWARADHELVRDDWVEALSNGQILTCPIAKLELLYAARDGAEFDQRSADLAQLRHVPVTRAVTNAAERAFRQLAHVHPRYHRSVKLADLLIAACAQDATVGVLHYDEDFDRLAEALSFESRWIAARGSL